MKGREYRSCASGLGETRRGGRVEALVVVLLLAAFFALEVSSGLWKSPAADEPAHLAGGLAYWRSTDLRMNPENGLLPQAWAALPVFLARVRFPAPDRDDWRRPNAARLGHELLYREGNDPEWILSRSRAMMTLLGIALGMVVFAWSSRLFGWPGGLISLTLCCFHPSILAHARLVTSDVAAALFLTASAWSLWRLLHDLRPATFLATAVLLSCLFLSKMSAVVILPIGAVMLAIRWRAASPVPVSIGRWRGVVSPRSQLAVFGLTSVLLAAMVGAALWAAYGFRYRPTSDPLLAIDHFSWPWAEVLQESGRKGEVIALARDYRLLPEAFLYGFAVVNAHGHARPQFFDGEISGRGWWGFFPYCFLVKTPLSEMLILFLAAMSAARFSRASNASSRAPALGYETTPLWTLLAVYWAFALTSSLNIGERHLVPTYPALFILAGAAALDVEKGGVLRSRLSALSGIALIVYCVESLTFYPHYLAYFNAIAGGPRKAYRHVVDSSLDWGQDLPGLALWLEHHRSSGVDEAPVYLSYFGVGDPEHYGIRATRLPSFPEFRTARNVEPLTGGIYCVSATMLESVLLRFPGAWTAAYDRLYRSVLADTQRYRTADSVEQDRLRQASGENFWNERFGLLDDLRFAKLCAFLRRREPDDSAGYSILIYELTDADVAGALEPMGR